MAGAAGIDLGGRTALAELAAVLAGADAVVVGNTGPAHLAAAVGTPGRVAVRPGRAGRPLGPVRGAGGAARRPGRAVPGQPGPDLPGAGHPCLDSVDPADVVAAVDLLAAALRHRPGPGARGVSRR